MAHTVRRLVTTGSLLVALLGAGGLAGAAHATTGADAETEVGASNTIWDSVPADPEPEPEPEPEPQPEPEPEPDNTIWD